MDLERYAVKIIGFDKTQNDGKLHVCILNVFAKSFKDSELEAKRQWLKNKNHINISLEFTIILRVLNKNEALEFISKTSFNQNEWSEAGFFQALRRIILSDCDSYTIEKLREIIKEAENN